MNSITIQTEANGAKTDASRTEASKTGGNKHEKLREELLVSIDIESVVVSAGRFIAKTKAGGAVSMSRSTSAELTISKVDSRRGRPPSYVGSAPSDEYLGLLRALADIRAMEKHNQC